MNTIFTNRISTAARLLRGLLLFSIMMLNIGGNARAQNEGITSANDLKSALEAGDAATITVTKSISLDLTEMLTLGASHTLTISNDQTVTITGNAININGQTLTINGGGTLVCARESGTTLFGTTDSQLSLENITVYVNKVPINVSTITVGDGATINLDAPETEKPLTTSDLTVKDGGTININSFTSIGIILDDALIIESGGTVNVGAGSYDNYGIYSTRTIELESGGTLIGKEGGAIYLAPGSQVKCASGLFSDQEQEFKSSEEYAKVVDEGVPAQENQLTVGFYQWNNTLFAKTDPLSGWELKNGALTIENDHGMWNWRMYKNKTFGSDATVTSLTITNGVTKIIDGVFLGCENLASVNIPATVTSIGKNALRFTASLTAITIPASITEIKAGAFQYSSLASVTFEGEAPTIAADAFLECNNLSKIIVPTGKKDAYQGAVGDGLKDKVVEGTAIENEGSSTVDGGILIGDGSAVASDVTVKGDVTFENVKTLETKVEDSQTSTLTLTGNNELGDITVKSNGSLTLEAADGANVTAGTVKCNGTFIDKTGTVISVTDGSNNTVLAITPPSPSQEIPYNSSSLTLSIPATQGATTTLEKKQENGTWQTVGSSLQSIALRSTPDGSVSVTIPAAGTYRVAITKDNVTLYTKPITVTKGSDPGSSEPPYVPPVYYTVTLPAVEGAATDPVAGDYEVESWSTFRFYLTLDEDYNQSQPVVTTSRGDAISPRSSDGAYLVKYVRTDVAITISGVVKNPDPVANAELHTGSTITARDGLLLITTDRPSEAQVIALTGQLIRSLALPSGTTRIDGLADGIYIVRLSDGTVQKVIVRK